MSISPTSTLQGAVQVQDELYKLQVAVLVNEHCHCFILQYWCQLYQNGQMYRDKRFSKRPYVERVSMRQNFGCGLKNLLVWMKMEMLVFDGYACIFLRSMSSYIFETCCNIRPLRDTLSRNDLGKNYPRCNKPHRTSHSSRGRST